MNIQILQNTLKFLERVPITGLEAYALCEAYAYFNSLIEQAKTTVPIVAEGTSG